MNYKNLSISSKKGSFYQKSKDPQEGYEKVVYGTDGDKVTYHRYENNITGTPKAFAEKEVSFDNKNIMYLELTLENGDEEIKISTVSRNANGYTTDAKTLISAMYGYDQLGEPATLTAKKKTYTKKDGTQGDSLAIYMNYVNIMGDNGKGLSTGYINFNDVPKAKEITKAGKKSWDFTDVEEFYYEKQNEITERLEKGDTSSKNSPAPANAPEAKQVPVPNDDLPF